MSKILRRPMFRGGPVDSRGTGITANLGYEAGGRVGYNQGNIVLGGDLYKPADFSKFVESYKPNMSPALINDLFNRKTGELKPGMTYENIFEAKDEEGKPISVFDADIFDYSNVGLKGDKSKNIFATSTGKDDFANALKTDVLDKLKESKAYEDTTPRGGSDAAQPDFGNEKVSVPEDPEQNKPSNTEISAEDLIRENAELFKELLGEGQKEKIKKARIGDASDYLLKFFEGSQKEGATVGSAAADVAGFATSRDSRTEKARAANEKVDQTATVLAINDYISGKRSKEQIEQTLAGYLAKAQMAKGTLGQEFAEFRAKQGTLGTTDMQIIIKGRFPGRPTEIIPAGSGDYEPNRDGSDEGKFYIEEETKDVYEVVNGKKVKRF